MEIKVSVNSMSADRHFPVEKPNPVDSNVAMSLNTHSFERKTENVGKIKFSVTVSYNPGVAQLKLSGDAIVKGDEEEIEELTEELKEELPSLVEKSILQTTLTKAIQLSDMLNVPAPIPLPNTESVKEEEVRDVGKEYG